MFIIDEFSDQIHEVKVKIKGSLDDIYYLIELKDQKTCGIFYDDEVLYAAPGFSLRFDTMNYYDHHWIISTKCREIDLENRENANKLFCNRLKRI